MTNPGFSNEFGFHSMPSIQTWREQISEQYLSFNSSVVTLRDHHPPPGNLNTSNYDNATIGQAQMTEAVELWYPVPDKVDPIANFSAWIYATQIFQADLYTSQIAFYRRGSGLPERQLVSPESSLCPIPTPTHPQPRHDQCSQSTRRALSTGS